MNHAISVDGRDVAAPNSLSVRGHRSLTAPSLTLTIDLRTYAWEPWDTHRLRLVPVAADVTLHAAAHRKASLGSWAAVPGSEVAPARTEHHGQFRFTLQMTGSLSEALEQIRAGGSVDIETTLMVQVFVGGAFMGFTDVWLRKPVPDKEWTQALSDAGFDDHLWIDIAIPRGPGPGGAAERLREALAARNRGHDLDAVAKTRVAVEAIEQAGFGGRSPKDIDKFIRENASKLTMRERRAAVHAAVKMLLSPPHHAGTDPEQYKRAHANGAVAIAAALLAMAEAEGPEPK